MTQSLKTNGPNPNSNILLKFSREESHYLEKVTMVEIFTSNWLNPKMWITNSMSSGSLTEVG